LCFFCSRHQAALTSSRLAQLERTNRLLLVAWLLSRGESVVQMIYWIVKQAGGKEALTSRPLGSSGLGFLTSNPKQAAIMDHARLKVKTSAADEIGSDQARAR
jgi:hypothetical protein